MTPKQTAFKEVKKEHKGFEVTIRGTSFDLPVKKTAEVQIYSMVQFFLKDLDLNKTRNFSDELSQEDIEKEVEYFANNLDKVFE